MRQDYFLAVRKRDGYHQDILSRPDLAEEIKQIKTALHKAKIKRRVIQNRLQLQLATVQKDLASATARLGVSDQSKADLRRQRAFIADLTTKPLMQNKELTRYLRIGRLSGD